MLNTKIMMDYLSALSMNNNREWYHANKDDYKKANGEFENLLQALILEIGKFDSSILQNNPKDLTFKLVRDTRFSHDKSPYNPAFRAHISSRGKLPVPVFSGWRSVCGYVQGCDDDGAGLYCREWRRMGSNPAGSGVSKIFQGTGNRIKKSSIRV